MSIEQALAENTAALRDLVAALKAQPVVGVPAAPAEKTPEPKAEKKVSAPKKAEKVEAPKVEAPKAEEKPAGASYDDVKATVFALAKIDRAHAVELLTQFGVTNAQHLKPEQYAEAVATGQDMLANLTRGAA